MKTVREIQSSAGNLWPDIDEAMNDIRRDCAAQLQAQGKDHEAALITIATDHQTAIEKLEATIALYQSAKDALKSAIADPEKDDKATVQAIVELVTEAEKPEIDRRREYLLAELKTLDT